MKGTNRAGATFGWYRTPDESGVLRRAMRLFLAGWCVALALLAAPSLADDVLGLKGTYVWKPPAVGTPTVYDVQISRNDKAWESLAVTSGLDWPYSATDGEMVRVRVRGCLGTLSAPWGCGEWSLPSDYKTFRAAVVPGAPGKPGFYCPEPFTKVSRDPATGEVTCSAP